MRRSGNPAGDTPGGGVVGCARAAADAPGRSRGARALAAGSCVLGAIVAWTLGTGPAAHAAPVAACLLPRTAAHHSEGLVDPGGATWAGSAPAGYPRADGDVNALMVFLSFPDAPPALTPHEVAADHYPATARFWAAASAGRFRLHLHTVDRWLTMPRSATAYRINRDWRAADRTAYLRDALTAADPAVDFRGYDVVYLVADPDAPGVDSDATKVVNLARPVTLDGNPLTRLVTVFERHPPDRNVLAHETGHVFDLPDLYDRPPPGSTADWDTRVGDWDLMGSQFGLAPEPFAWHKWKLGWLRPEQVGCVAGPGTSYYDLAPDESPGGGTKLLVLRTGPDSVLAIEARARTGNDAEACRTGVLLYRVRSDRESGDGPVAVVDGHPGSSACAATSVYPPLADAPLGVGESYALPDGTARVTVTGREPDGDWAVKVTQHTTGAADAGRDA
ncbi:M6 family metalloprotease domain-containing protein [Streptomyces sp. NRRL F-5123]|uniref:M6 family metalloprotease domain-containing protein n=1 Tax=Streptomyces sp. NRRL F-5123 TaxID=1463856 RepID=UPI00099E0030